MAFGFERAEVVLFPWVILVTKIVVHSDGLHDPCDRFIAESGDPNRDDSCFYAGPEVLAQPIIENRICSVFDVIIVRSCRNVLRRWESHFQKKRGPSWRASSVQVDFAYAASGQIKASANRSRLIGGIVL